MLTVYSSTHPNGIVTGNVSTHPNGSDRSTHPKGSDR